MNPTFQLDSPDPSEDIGGILFGVEDFVFRQQEEREDEAIMVLGVYQIQIKETDTEGPKVDFSARRSKLFGGRILKDSGTMLDELRDERF